jgi:hypothetical protein
MQRQGHTSTMLFQQFGALIRLFGSSRPVQVEIIEEQTFVLTPDPKPFS